MSAQKKPVYYVAFALIALILLPLLIWLISLLLRSGKGADFVTPANGGAETTSVAPVGFEQLQIADRAQTLLDGPIAEAAQAGRLSLQAVLELRRFEDKAASARASGNTQKAAKLYTLVVDRAEGMLALLKQVDEANALRDTVYQRLEEAEPLKAVFSESYGQAVAAFDQAQLQLTAENYPACLDSLKQSGEILDDLANRSEAYITMRLEEAKTALDGLALEKALAAYEAILALAPKHAEAMAGLTMVESIRGIAGDLQAINALEGAGQWEAALGKLEGLLSAKPQNAYLLARKEQLTEKIRERTFQQRIAEAEAFVAAGDLASAVASLEAALKVKNSESISARLEDLKKQILTARLEALLANGYSALQAGRYADARDAYKEALGLAPKSKEAQTGYEKASSMLLSGIRYSQNLANADKYIASGRYPLAAKFFNKALSSRPSQLAKAQQAKESTIREILERESQPVPVRVLSDKKTYVSLTGVFPPERVESKDLSLFPDVYTLKGTRKGYRTIERTIQIDSTQSGTDIRIQCSEKE